VKIRNRLAPVVSNDEIREIVRFVVPHGVANFTVELEPAPRRYNYAAVHERWSGRASYYTRRVLVRAPATRARYPRPHVTDFAARTGKGYLRSAQFSYEEDLVHYLAHELRHLWQARYPRGWRVWGARGQFSERDADAYAIRMVRAWRRRSLEAPTQGP
jgi:hypothetical protein